MVANTENKFVRHWRDSQLEIKYIDCNKAKKLILKLYKQLNTYRLTPNPLLDHIGTSVGARLHLTQFYSSAMRDVRHVRFPRKDM